MTEDEKKALLLAGKMASAAHAVIYGSDIFNLGSGLRVLSNCLNDYDSHIHDWTRRKNAAC
jgi:hypothetical protein